jgi:uncharacterized YccA/Bax inhibitor family protein
MTSKNPLLSPNVIANAPMVYSSPMTVQGTVNRTAILLSLVVVAATLTWSRTTGGHGDAVLLTMAGGILGMITCLVTVFKKEWAPVSAPVYSICQGMALGWGLRLLEHCLSGSGYAGLLAEFRCLVRSAWGLPVWLDPCF